MGLDMYLYKKHYVENWEHNKDQQFSVSVKLNGKRHPGVNPKKVTYVQEEIGYWRKANQIHDWFVQNVQNGKDECQESWVEVEQLETLLDLCKRVDENHNLAETLLPTQSGFFFGGTDYDDWYFNQIKSTIKMLEKELGMIQIGGLHSPEYYYRASW